MIETNSGKPYINVIFGNFYSPGYDDPDFVDETMELTKSLVITALCLTQKTGKISGNVIKPESGANM